MDVSTLEMAREKLEGLFSLLRRPLLSNSNESDQFNPGDEFAAFRILRILGSGGMGCVYLAQQATLGRLVALKVCRPEIGNHPHLRQRFDTEGRALALLKHPYIVPVLAAGTERHIPYLVMEYVPGPSLADVLCHLSAASSDSRASELVTDLLATGSSTPCAVPHNGALLDQAYRTWIIQVLAKVAQGLAAVHNAGIVHRDLKPANVVIAPDGTPRIVDFGLAKADPDSAVTASGEFFGTPAYASPEQARGDYSALSSASDVFSFGILLYECLSLRRPFDGSSAVDLLHAIQNHDPVHLRSRDRRIPWELEAIADKCLSKVPADRYPNGCPLAADLDSFLDLRPIAARRTTLARRILRGVQRHPWKASFYAVFLLACAFGIQLGLSAFRDYRQTQTAHLAKAIENSLSAADQAAFRGTTAQEPTWVQGYLDDIRTKGIKDYSFVIAHQPDSVWPRVQRARLYLEFPGRAHIALADLAHARQTAPHMRSIPLFMAHANDRLKRPREASSLRKIAADIYPTDPDDLYWLGILAADSDATTSTADSHFAECLLLKPQHYWARLDRAYLPGAITQSQITATLENLQLAKSFRPDLPFASDRIVVILADARHDVDSALHECKDAIHRHGRDLQRTLHLSSLLRKKRQYAEAKSALIQPTPNVPETAFLRHIGDIDFDAADYKAAADTYRRAIAAGNRDTDLFVRYAQALAHCKDNQGAEALLREAMSAREGDAIMYNVAAHWFESQNQLPEAEKVFRKTITFGDIFEGKAQRRSVALAFTHYHGLLKIDPARLDDRLSLLRTAIQRFDSREAVDVRDSLYTAEDLSIDFKVLLAEELLASGRQEELQALFATESKKAADRGRPTALGINEVRATRRFLISSRREQDALRITRLAEFANQFNPHISDSEREVRRIALGAMVNDSLSALNMQDELLTRLESQRLLRQPLREEDYWTLARRYMEPGENLDRLGQVAMAAVEAFPKSLALACVNLHYLHLSGKHKEAVEAYEHVISGYRRELDGSMSIDKFSFGSDAARG